MPELIDRLSLIDKLDQGQKKALDAKDFMSFYALVYFKVMLQETPTIEAEPVRYGRWLSYTGTHYTGKENEYGDPEYKEHIFFVCSNCRRKTVVREHFCPNCGAKMYQTGGTISKERFAEIGGSENG